MGAEGVGGRRVWSSSISKPRKNNLFKRWKGVDGFSADSASAASYIMAVMINKGWRNFFLYTRPVGLYPERTEEEAPLYYVGRRKCGYADDKDKNNNRDFYGCCFFSALGGRSATR